MNSKNNVILIGGFHEIIELCETCNKNIIGIIDKDLNNDFQGYTILGDDSYANELQLQYEDIPLVLTPDKPELRQKLFHYYSKYGFEFASLIHPGASISESANIGRGVIIQDFVNVSTKSKIGDFVKLNTSANIMHDVIIDSFTTVAPNAVLLGNVNISDKCYIGSNATILPNVEIKQQSVVGAGAVVTSDILTQSTVVGNPAKIRNNVE